MATTTPNYEIDPKDPKLTAVTTEKTQALSDNEKMYDQMSAEMLNQYDNSLGNVHNWEAEQKKLQQQQSDFAIEQINQQKEQAQKDFQKEASAAYVDYQKQINPYGVEAEQRAAMGMTNTGYSESSLVSMYNQYQVRYTAAREMYQKALMNYNNQITEAKLQNSAILAEIAYEALQKETELTLNWMQYENNLLMSKADDKMQIMSMYETKWQNVYDNLMDENKLAEEVRQYNATHSLQQAQLQLQRDQFEYQKAQDKKAATISKSSGGSSSGGSKKSGYVSAKGANAIVGKKTGAGINKSQDATKETTNNKKNEPTIDMNSVLSLGLGPISASKLDSLVASGVVREYVSGGKIKFAYTASGLKQKQLYSGLR